MYVYIYVYIYMALFSFNFIFEQIIYPYGSKIFEEQKIHKRKV